MNFLVFCIFGYIQQFERDRKMKFSFLSYLNMNQDTLVSQPRPFHPHQADHKLTVKLASNSLTHSGGGFIASVRPGMFSLFTSWKIVIECKWELIVCIAQRVMLNVHVGVFRRQAPYTNPFRQHSEIFTMLRLLRFFFADYLSYIYKIRHHSIILASQTMELSASYDTAYILSPNYPFNYPR